MIDMLAQAFCEATSVVSWEDTPKHMKEWYRDGIRAVIAALDAELTRAGLQLKLRGSIQ